MKDYSIYLPCYSIGSTVYQEIPKVCSPYGKKILVIGGNKGIAAAKELIEEALAESDLTILDYLWYGGEATYENVEKLQHHPLIEEADMLFGVGGGKALDTVKCLAVKTGKPLFTFPTIASNCAACTCVSIMYNEDGSFKEPYFFPKPPVHAFIHTGVIAKSPARYMWAGIGDTYAKYFESMVSSRGEDLTQYVALGVNVSKMCYEPLIQYGKKALDDQKKGEASYEFEQVVLAIVVTTGIASILLTKDHIIDYNTGLAHAIYYALTSFPHIEEGHLHGELVGFGVLLLLLCDNDKENFDKVYALNKSIQLPVSIEEVEITREDLPAVIKKTISMKDIDHNPYRITEEMLLNAFETLEKINQN
ncbi:MAG: iron-containing alcohol dehydrogenase family protein [Lachnospiraceae bacterium]|nr:iron-containing alcohol dehydrogenase family protein [Lachnospiraceae bacterium]